MRVSLTTLFKTLLIVIVVLFSATAHAAGLHPGLNDFSFIPSSIYPKATGNVYFVDIDNGSDSSNCTSPATACFTINHALSLTTSGSNDVVVMFPTLTIDGENIAIDNNNVTLICPVPSFPSFGGLGSGACTIDPQAGSALTIYGQATFIENFTIVTEDPTLPVVVFSGESPSIQGPNDSALINDQLCPDGGSEINVLWGGGSNLAFIGDIFECQGILDCQGTLIGNGQYPTNGLISGNYFYSGRITDSGDTGPFGGAACSGSLVTGNVFTEVTTGPYIDMSLNTEGAPVTIFGNDLLSSFPTLANLISLAPSNPEYPTYPGQNNPPGDQGSVLADPSQQTTIISSHITTTPQAAMTGLGTTQINDIILTTDSTGLASGTIFTITSNAPGSPTVCTVPVNSLSANVSISCVAAGSMIPFQLPSTDSLNVSCTGAACTGSGTITIIPQATRLVPYAAIVNDNL